MPESKSQECQHLVVPPGSLAALQFSELRVSVSYNKQKPKERSKKATFEQVVRHGHSLLLR